MRTSRLLLQAAHGQVHARAHHEGLIAINGHLGSSIASTWSLRRDEGRGALRSRGRGGALAREGLQADERGEPRFYVELQHTRARADRDQPAPHQASPANSSCRSCATTMPLPGPRTRRPRHALLHLDGARSRRRRADAYSPELYVKSPEEMAKLFGGRTTTRRARGAAQHQGASPTAATSSCRLRRGTTRRSCSRRARRSEQRCPTPWRTAAT
jgi:DNA polymerase III alpha subunit